MNPIMRQDILKGPNKYLQVLVILMLVPFVIGCGSSVPAESKKIVIQVNDIEITLDEFDDLMELEVYADPELDMTPEARIQFIEYLVQKELLIQEAIRLNIDMETDFLNTIEKYWESTLIQILYDRKSKAINDTINNVTEDEVKAYYTNHKADFDQPFDKEKEEILRIIKAEKIEKMLEEWTKKLRASASIRIDKSSIIKQSEN